MNVLARWLRAFIRREPSRRAPTLKALRPEPTLPKPSVGFVTGRRYYDDKAMRAGRDYQDKETA